MKKLKELYEKAKSIPIGQEADCPSCRKKFIKKTKAQAFCGSKTNTKCKDKYWNTVTPHKRNNTTRISPASAAWMSEQQDRRDRHVFYDDDQVWDAHKDSF